MDRWARQSTRNSQEKRCGDSLGHCVDHILSKGGNQKLLICNVFIKGIRTSIRLTNIKAKLCAMARKIDLSSVGIDPDLIGSHSL